MFQFCAYSNGMELQKKAEEKKRPEILTRKRFGESLYNSKSELLLKRHRSSFIYYKALLEQTDNFSCGYRMLFHMLCVEKSITKAKEQTNFEEYLGLLLKNERYLKKYTTKIQDYIEEIEPSYNFSDGLTDRQVISFIASKLPHLKEKVLTIYIDEE